MTIKIRRNRKVFDNVYDFTEYYIINKDMIWVTIYQGIFSTGRTHFQKSRKSWKWIVKYVKGDEWEYEEFKYFKEAKNRGIQITEKKIEEYG